MASRQDDLLKAAVRSVRGALVAVLGFSLVINVLMLTGPLFMLQIYDRILPSHSVPTLVAMAVLVALLYMVFGFLEAIRGRVLSRVARRVDEHLADASFDAAVRLPNRGGELVKTLAPTRDLETLRQFLSGPGPATIFDLPWMPIYLSIVFLFHPTLGLVATGAIVVIVTLALANEYASRQPMRDAASSHAQGSALVDDARRNAEVTGTMGMLGNLRRVWTASRRDYLDSAQTAGDRGDGFSAAIKAARFGFQSAILGTAAYLAIFKAVSPGTMIAASIIMSRALAPIDQAVGHWRGFVNARQSLARLRDVIASDAAAGPRTALPAPKASLDIADLSLAPPGMQKLTLKNVGFSLAAGEALCVLGASGSGKSTLARALVGVWPPHRGAIRLDGTEIDHFPDEARARHIGYLPQDVALFEGTVAENIARFGADASSEDIVAAAELSGAIDVIRTLPDGFETQLGPGGSGLSAGQRQRIALARAVFGDPFLIVLDEPNSNLDSEGEQALANAVRALRERGRIVVIVAHRATAISLASQVLVLDAGLQAAFGPRDEVLPKILRTVSTEGEASAARS
ncbi:MAG: type I secretion system permease/ATPase [Rhodobiaceae bacterium]|nr:type I secretion system permease/ATPase [Rhodobiaceae bacterium]